MANMIPFVLLKRSGVTSTLTSMCTSLTTQGLNFHSMETFLIDRRWNSFLKQCDLLRVHEMITGKSHGTCNFWESAFLKLLVILF